MCAIAINTNTKPTRLEYREVLSVKAADMIEEFWESLGETSENFWIKKFGEALNHFGEKFSDFRKDQNRKRLPKRFESPSEKYGKKLKIIVLQIYIGHVWICSTTPNHLRRCSK